MVLSRTPDLQRRRLLAWAGRGMVLLSAGGLAACGGGGGDDPAGGGGNPPTGDLGGDGAAGAGSAGAPVGNAQRLDTLQSVRSAVIGAAGTEAGFDSVAVARALQALPTLERVGVSSTVGNVWARFTDGLMLVVPNNLDPTAATGLAPALATTYPLSATAPAGLADNRRHALAADDGFDTPAILTARQYRQLDMFGAVPSNGSPDAAHLCLDYVDRETLPKLRRMAVGRGFTLPPIQQTEPVDAGIDNGVSGLTDLSGDGVFFITACAAQAGNDDTPHTVICTATPANEANLARYDALIRSGLLTVAVAQRGVDGAWDPQPCLAIGPAWVAAGGWRFPTACIGIFNLSGAPSMSDWIQPLNGAGLRHILAWRQPVSWQRMLAFGDDLIQMNLATNNFEGRHVVQNAEPRLRAYGMGETVDDLADRGIAGDGGEGALMYLQEPTPALYVNTLLPTIDYVTLREVTLEFEVVGQFGQRADTDDQTARIEASASPGPGFSEPLLERAADAPLSGGEPLRDPLWEGGTLQTVLNLDQLDRGGYVQVWNGGRCSNVVPITHWEIPIQAVSTINTLTLALTVTVRLRADVHAWRLDPEGQPRNGAIVGAMQGSVYSRADFVASGTLERYDADTRTRTTVTWSGQGGVGNTVGQFSVILAAVLEWDRRTMTQLTLAVTGGATYTQTKVVEQFDVNGELLHRTEDTTTIPVSLAVAGVSLQGLIEMDLDDEWTVRPGRFDLPPVDADVLPAPPQLVQNTQVSWGAVRPDFPPRNDYGGT